MAQFDQVDLDLFEYYQRKLQKQHTRFGDGNCPKRVWREAELLWAGEHHLLIRHGVYQKIRVTLLVNREHLLLERGNPDENVMIELALATVHAVHFRTSLVGHEIVVHSTGPKNGLIRFRGRRWSAKFRRELFAYCEEQDVAFAEKEAAWIEKFDEANAHSQAMVALVERLGVSVRGVSESSSVKRPPNHRYKFSLTDPNYLQEIKFIPKSSGSVEVIMQSVRFAPEDFELLVNAFAQMQIRRGQRKAEEA